MGSSVTEGLLPSPPALASALGLLHVAPQHLYTAAILFHLKGEKKSLQNLVQELKSVLAAVCEAPPLAGAELTPSTGTGADPRARGGGELLRADPLGAISDLPHHTCLCACGEAEVPAHRSRRVQLPETFLGVCSGDGAEPMRLDYCHPGISRSRKSPAAPNPCFPTCGSPRPACGDDNSHCRGKRRLIGTHT